VPLLSALLLLPAATPAAQLRKDRTLRPGQKTCLDCHDREASAYRSRASVHAPVRAGTCESCHRRHGVVGVLRLAAGDPDLCLSCHAGTEAPGAAAPGRAGAAAGAPPSPPTRPAGAATRILRFPHPPASAMKCGACHDPHGSDRRALLKGDDPKLCLACHDAAAFEGVSKHAAPAADCLACHEPHGTGEPGALRRPAAALCGGCHPGTSEPERRAHAGATPPGAACLTCHDPHAAPRKGLLRRRLHAPLAAGADGCAACHRLEGEGTARYALAAAEPDLCLTCHDDPRPPPNGQEEPGHRVHAPAAAGCLACHAPHASDGPGLLTAAQGELCGGCHEVVRAAARGRAPHAPAAGQECTACHRPHAGGPALLGVPPPGLCGTCHEPVAAALGRRHRHPPAADCLSCHDPHGSEHAGVLRNPPGDLCAACHETGRGAAEALVGHAPVTDGRCAACHEPHGSDAAGLLVADLAAACLGCHQTAAGAWAGDRRHAPFAGGDCLSCHAPHAAAREGLLIADAGTLCRTCHETLEGEDSGAPGHAPVRRGQCLTCHGPHGGHPPGMLRRADVRAVCLSCHVEEGRTMVDRKLTVHAPFRKDPCLTCHAPHAAPAAGLLKVPPRALCGGCHDPSAARLAAAHQGLLTAGSDCSDCHAPHASEVPRLLWPVQHKPFADDACSRCHRGGPP
jgi:predicted CXXCH cytochrome family protein